MCLPVALLFPPCRSGQQALSGTPQVISCVCYSSPLPLLCTPGKSNFSLLSSHTALQRLRGWDNVDDEIEEMCREDQSEKQEGRLSVMNLCTFQALRWQLISIIVMMMGQQLSGINGVGGGRKATLMHME